MSPDEIRQAFEDSHGNADIRAARSNVLTAATQSFGSVAELAQTAGSIQRDDALLAVALLCSIAQELVHGILLVAAESRAYAAGCLLRQLVEVEYLMLVGYGDPAALAEWYNAEPEELRRNFNPSQMRKASSGLYQDLEYWIHCEVGGHPHPKSRILLASHHSPKEEPLAFLLPDTAHHVTRLWTSLHLLMPKLRLDPVPLELALPAALKAWANTEHPLVFAFNGVAV